MVTAWTEMSHRLPEALRGATEATLSVPPPPNIPCFDGKLSGVLAFLAFHESYHVGQAVYQRKWLGHGPVVG